MPCIQFWTHLVKWHRQVCLISHLCLSVGWACDWLQAGRSRDRFPLGGQDFLHPSRLAPNAHPFSHTVGTGSFPGVQWPRHGIDYPPPSGAEVKERVQLYLYSTSGPSWPVTGWTLPCVSALGHAWGYSFTLTLCCMQQTV